MIHARGLAAKTFVSHMEHVDWPPGPAVWASTFAFTAVFWALLAASRAVPGAGSVSGRHATMPSQLIYAAACLQAARWAAACADQRSGIASPPLHAAPAPAAPAAVTRTAAIVCGTQESSTWYHASQERVLSFDKSAKGDHLVCLGRRATDKAMFRFPRTVLPSLDTAIAAQFNLAADFAVMNHPEAMAIYTSIVPVNKFGTNIAAVRAAIVTGKLRPLSIFAKPELVPTFLGVNTALTNLRDLCDSMYDVSCPLSPVLHSMVADGELLTHFESLVEFDHLSPTAATVLLYKRFDEAMAEWIRSAEALLQPWFAHCMVTMMSADGGLGMEGTRRVSPLLDFNRRVKAFPLCMQSASSRIGAYSHAPSPVVARDTPKYPSASFKREGSFHTEMQPAPAKHPRATPRPTAQAQAAPSPKAWPDVIGPTPAWVTAALLGQRSWYHATLAQPRLKQLRLNGIPLCGNFLLKQDPSISNCGEPDCRRAHVPAPAAQP
jgi:hypothetical protein